MLHESLAIEMQIDSLIEEGDFLAARYTERGTFRAPFRGHEPTGKSFEWFEMRDGRIARRWGARDHASQARQIGLPL
jgi:predicted ester cyclase